MRPRRTSAMPAGLAGATLLFAMLLAVQGGLRAERHARQSHAFDGADALRSQPGFTIDAGPAGPVVTSVAAGSAAERGGLAIGDRVVAIDGVPASRPGAQPTGSPSRIDVLRDGVAMRLKLR